MFSAPFLSTLLNRVKAVVRRVARPGVERMRMAPTDAALSVSAPISPVLRGIVKGWMSAKLRALSALMRRIEAGETPGPTSRAARATKGDDAPEVRAPVPPDERLPRGFGWMCGFGPYVREDGAAFAAWLNEPAMQAKVSAAPERMASLIGPILTATGQRTPAWFPAKAKKTATAPPPQGAMQKQGVDAAGPGEIGGHTRGLAARHRRQPGQLLSPSVAARRRLARYNRARTRASHCPPVPGTPRECRISSFAKIGQVPPQHNCDYFVSIS